MKLNLRVCGIDRNDVNTDRALRKNRDPICRKYFFEIPAIHGTVSDSLSMQVYYLKCMKSFTYDVQLLFPMMNFLISHDARLPTPKHVHSPSA